MRASIFPGQGAQFEAMGIDLVELGDQAKEMLEVADEILGFRISEIMCSGSADDLLQTKVTQPAVFLHSVIKARLRPDIVPQAVAGHSLGEFSALVASGALDFENGLKLVAQRALAMQEACDLREGTMAAIVGLEDAAIEEICENIDGVVPANYNCPGQLVISGTREGVEAAMEQCTEAGARRAIPLSVGGAFHSPLMEPARQSLEDAITSVTIIQPSCPVYQNVSATPETDPETIKRNLISQLTAPVKWTQTMKNMVDCGVDSFVEIGGKGKVLAGFVRRLDRSLATESI